MEKTQDEGQGPARSRQRHVRLSETLAQLSTAEGPDIVSIGDLMAAIGERAFGALLVLFALPVVIPLPIPGISAIFALPLLLISLQLLFARPRPWLPRFLRERSLSRASLETLVRKISPSLRRIERISKPRLLWFSSRLGECLIGLCCVLLALIVFLPIPGGNMFPSVAIALFGFGLLERDGVICSLALIVSIGSTALLAGIIYGFIKGGMLLFAAMV